MSRRNVALSLAAAPAAALLISSCALAARNAGDSNLTVQCTETLVPQAAAVTTGGVVGTGHCTMTGLLHDSGPTTDYRTANPTTIVIHRVISFARGTITFVITIPQIGAGGERWTIASGTRAYSKLHGRGYEAVDDWVDSPATFVLKGAVSQAPATAG
jgi:hypothetical protein